MKKLKKEYKVVDKGITTTLYLINIKKQNTSNFWRYRMKTIMTTTGSKSVSNNANVAGVAMSLNKAILPKRYY